MYGVTVRELHDCIGRDVSFVPIPSSKSSNKLRPVRDKH